MVESYYQLAIRFLHILSGVMWIGGIYLWGMVLAPTITRRVAPQARGPVMKEVLPRLSRYLIIAGVVTVVTGLWTMGIITGFDQLINAFQGGGGFAGYGPALGAALVAALIMIGIAVLVIMPAADKMLAMMSKAPPPGTPPGPPPPEMMATAKRLMMASMTNLVLGTLALGLMAYAVSTRSGL